MYQSHGEAGTFLSLLWLLFWWKDVLKSDSCTARLSSPWVCLSKAPFRGQHGGAAGQPWLVTSVFRVWVSVLVPVARFLSSCLAKAVADSLSDMTRMKSLAPGVSLAQSCFWGHLWRIQWRENLFLYFAICFKSINLHSIVNTRALNQVDWIRSGGVVLKALFRRLSWWFDTPWRLRTTRLIAFQHRGFVHKF